MIFGNPILLWSLALLPLLAWLAWLAQRRRRHAAALLGEAGLVARLSPRGAALWRARRSMAALAAFALLALAASRPQYGRIEQVLRRAGVDVIIALDVSPSMLAQDVRPNRLAKAKESLKRLVQRLQGNRVGIIAFAGDAFLNCPMTTDLGMANLVLDSLDEKSVAIPGTDLGAAIRTAKGAFERGGVGQPALVLLTDGEDNEGEGLKAAKEAAQAGIQIFCIGIGTETGAPVPREDKGYKETAEGTKVNSRMDLTGLGEIAKAADGAAFRAGDNPAAAVESVAKRIDRMSKTDRETRKTVIHQDRFEWFLPPAMVLILWLLLSRPSRREPEPETATTP